MRSVPEAAAVGAAGAVVAGTLGLVGGPAWAFPMAAVGGINGALAGWCRVYDWRHPTGPLAFALDSSWALLTTTAGLFAHTVAGVSADPQYAPELSERRNRHVYRNGFRPRKGFAITLGNVVSGAGDVSNPRRARLVTDHEDVHVWQARWLGPLYPVAYGGFALVGALAGVATWVLRRVRRRPGKPPAPLGRTVEACAYYLNPLEYWAYCRDDHWPPHGMVEGLGPQRPLVRSLAAVRAGRARRAATR